ncbi:hypothetical protein ACI78V_03640 [Geodermatophilus sp. SYSU D00742]
MTHGAVPASPVGDREPVGGREPVVPWAGVPPQAPTFTATVDQRQGLIRTRGHLDAVAAELLGGSIVALQRLGHRRIAVRLGHQVTVDAEARAVLAELGAGLAADGVCLVVE